MILAVLGILLSNNAMAVVQELTLSDLRFTWLDGTLMEPDANGIVGPVGLEEEFYIYFDIRNSGESLVSDNKMSLSSLGSTTIDYFSFTLNPGETIDNARIKVKFTSSTCPGTKDIRIVSYFGTPVVGSNTGKISYNGPDCISANLEVTQFAWLPENPADVWADISMTDKKYGFSFTLKNNAASSFSGRYTLIAKNYHDITAQTYVLNICTKTENIELLNPGDTVELKIDPSDNPSSPEYCPVRAIGYVYIYVYNNDGVSITPANGQYRSYLAPIPMWKGDSYPYIEKSIYAPGEVVNVYDKGMRSAQFTIPTGSTYNIIVQNKETGEVIYDASIPINEQLEPGRKFGTDPGITSDYYIGPTNFLFPPSIPGSLKILTQLRDSSGDIIFCAKGPGGSIPGYVNRASIISLTPLILCDTTKTTSNPGCTCLISISSTYDVTCTLKHPNIVNQGYLGRFIFSSSLEEDLKKESARAETDKRIIGITITPTEPTAIPIIGNSIEFITTPKPSTETERTYLFSFKCDLDGDSYQALVCGGDDCDDNDDKVYPEAPEVCDGKDNNCDGNKDEGMPDNDVDGVCNLIDTENTAEDCNDGIDNEGDSFCDYEGCICSGSNKYCGTGDSSITTLAADPGCACTSYLECGGHWWDWNLCDRTECQACGGTNYFISSIFGGDCYTCTAGTTKCESYISDQTTCIDDPCSLLVCLWDAANSNCCTDSDEDTLCDVVDNCPADANTDQADVDGDGIGDACDSFTDMDHDGFYREIDDCNDNDALINPGATEVCDEADNDCDDAVDEDVKTIFYQDSDLDGYGDPLVTTEACTAPSGYVADNTDCDDSAISVHPMAFEACNGIDDNCDGAVDETFANKGQACEAGIGLCIRTGTYICSADGASAVCSAAPGEPSAEVCTDLTDNDCNGLVDCNDDACIGSEMCEIGVRATLNHFYGWGIMDTTSAPRASTYCEGGDGNFYEYDIPYSEIGWNDCGPAKITIPVEETIITENTVNIEWTRQSSMFPLTYYLEYSGHPWDESMAWTGIASFAYPLAYVWDVTDVPDGKYTIKLTPNDGYVNGTINTTWIKIWRKGDISGKVQCCDNEGENCVNVPYAKVFAADVSTTADEKGEYVLDDVPSGLNVIMASNIGNKTQRISDVMVSSEQIAEDVDFKDVCPIVVDCNPDCTVVGTEKEPYPLCDPICEDVNGCHIMDGCENVPKGTKIKGIVNEEPSLITCCIGPSGPLPEVEGKPKLEVDANNIARTTRIVYYKGKPVKMVVVTWD